MAPFTTNLDDVFISVKTTKHYHHSRLPDIISTWFQFAKDQVRDQPFRIYRIRFYRVIYIPSDLSYLYLVFIHQLAKHSIPFLLQIQFA